VAGSSIEQKPGGGGIAHCALRWHVLGRHAGIGVWRSFGWRWLCCGALVSCLLAGALACLHAASCSKQGAGGDAETPGKPLGSSRLALGVWLGFFSRFVLALFFPLISLLFC
jgi:hypothetical protein